ncbi:MAG: serine hydrolase domain-containing protein [Alkalilacustris sp.]
MRLVMRCIGVVALCAGLALAWPGRAEQLAAHVDGLVGGLMAADQVPGAIVAVVSGDDVVLRGYGSVDLEAGIPAGPDDVRFEIGSITKLFTWLAVMMLEEAGQLDLHADVAGYLPGFDIPGETPLTLAQLMSHRPGFEESYRLFDPALGALPRRAALAASAPAQVMPRGAVTAYSNWGVALAGQIVEEVAGVPFEDFLQDRILIPLGMHDTTYGEATARPDQPPLASSYRVQAGVAHPAFRVDLGSFGPAGTAASTAADMARFLRFLMGDGELDGVWLLRPETMARMRTRLYDDAHKGAGIAHGFQARPMFGTEVFGHAGGLNEFLSNLVFLPEIGAGVFISQNGGAGATLPFVGADLILARLAAEAGLQAPPPQPVPDAADRAQDVAGGYIPNRRAFTGPGQLLAALEASTVTALPDGAILVPAPILGTMLRHDPIAPDIWQSAAGDRVAVIRDDAGRVVRLVDSSGAFTHERVRLATSPAVLAGTLGLAAVLALTTLLGLIWRRGLQGGGRAGTAAALAGLGGAVSVVGLIAAGGVMAGAAATLGAEFLMDRPQPSMVAFLALGNVVAVMAGVVLVSLVPVWRAAGWSRWRRLHHAAFAVALAALAASLVNWGLAFGGAF